MFLAVWGGVAIDAAFNKSWLQTASTNFKWYNFFTTQHFVTAIYLNHTNGFISVAVIFSVVVGFLVALTFGKD